MAILTTAQKWESQAEWRIHLPIGLLGCYALVAMTLNSFNLLAEGHQTAEEGLE